MKAKRARQPWYVAAFTEDYLKRYAHRSDAAAEAETPFIVKALRAKKGARILDLCCGAGRHARALSKRGYHMAGFDLSADLLQAAQRVRTRGTIGYVRADMRRVPFKSEIFDGAINIFTSFGYFSARDNELVLREAARVLKPGARLVMDFINIAGVRRTLVPYSEKETECGRVTERRRYDQRSGRLTKTVCWIEDGRPQYLRESVRAYTAAELTRLLQRAGFRVLRRYGDLYGAKLNKTSPRCVLVAEK